MAMKLDAVPVPLREDADGALRVGDSRVLLELVIHRFDEGATPEEIAQAQSTLQLRDVYAVISYYLRHRTEVEQYLQRRDALAREARAKIEASQRDLTEIGERITDRRRARG